MAYLNSTDVIVFPIAKERDPSVDENRLFTEYNVSNLIRQLIGDKNKGFVISTTSTNDGKATIVEFNLYGYYFKVTITEDWITKILGNELGDGLYASISINEEIDEIEGQDVSENGRLVYEGLQLTTEEPSSGIYLKILNVNNGSFQEISRDHGFARMLIGGIDGKH